MELASDTMWTLSGKKTLITYMLIWLVEFKADVMTRSSESRKGLNQICAFAQHASENAGNFGALKKRDKGIDASLDSMSLGLDHLVECYKLRHDLYDKYLGSWIFSQGTQNLDITHS